MKSIKSYILDGIETITRSKKDWDRINAKATYKPNKEIDNPQKYSNKYKVKCLNGTFVGKRRINGVYCWLGIPYAKQPVGELRFKKAEPAPKSDKTYEAFNYMHYDYQPHMDTRHYDILEMMGEDCLGLNIWSNPRSKLDKKPVLVYIHGGGWYVGSSSNPLFRGELFTFYNPDIIYISVDYRLGVYGLLNSSLFKDGNDYPDSYNNGLYDVVESLRWIKQNIAGFGGDPDNITICGESAGGGSVSLLCTLKCVIDEKLVQKAIPMSGNCSQAGRMEATDKLPELLKEYFNTDKLSYIAGLPDNRLADFWLRYGDWFHNCVMQDGKSIKKDPYSAYEKGINKDIIFLQGCTGNESKYYEHIFGDSEHLYNALAKANIERIKELAKGDEKFLQAFNKYEEAVKEIYPNENEAYNKMLCDYSLGGGNFYQTYEHTKNGGKDFLYVFDKPYMGSWKNLDSAHAVDCNFLSGVFGYEEAPGTWKNLVLSRKFQKMISNFCKYGDPSFDDVKWNPYSIEKENIMYFDKHASFKEVEHYQSSRYSTFNKAMKLDKTLSLKYVVSQAYCYMILQDTFGKENFPDVYPPYKVEKYSKASKKR